MIKQIEIALLPEQCFDELTTLEFIKRNGGDYIKYIKNPSVKLQEFAVSENHEYVEYINNVDELVQIKLITHYPYLIQYINNPSPSAQIMAINASATLAAHIKNITKEAQNLAVSKNAYLIEYFENPDNEVQMTAILTAIKNNNLLGVFVANIRIYKKITCPYVLNILYKNINDGKFKKMILKNKHYKSDAQLVLDRIKV